MSLFIDRDGLDAIDMSSFGEFLEWNPQYKAYLSAEPGKEAYRLLTSLCKQIASHNPIPLFCDLGTLYGSSSIVMNVNPSVQIFTYDIQNFVPNNVKSIANISTIKRKMFSAQLDADFIAKADLVLLDIDPHCGLEEAKFVEMLRTRGFKGVLVCDDIYLNDGMRKFWESIPETKWDVTHLGHSTGTGIVLFPGAKYSIEVR